MKINRIMSSNKNHYVGVNPCKFITVHDTDNKKVGANAINHSKYMNNGSKTTWHYTVDDTQIIQHFEDDVQCWHCGDGIGVGNTQSIGVEMCVNIDGDINKTVEKTISLIKYLMNKHNIPISNVVQHNKWSGKNCPSSLRSGYPINWTLFKSKIGNKEVDNNLPISDILTGEEIIQDLVKKVKNGRYGNGEERKKKLGKLYDIIQGEINNNK